MTQEEKQTEQIIMDAARKVFQQSGLGGARMQQIADEAGINKALLHYYFRNKKKLFEAVFKEDFNRYMIPLSGILLRETGLTVEKRIVTFVQSFIRTLNQHPHLPLFVMHEIASNPDRMLGLVKGGDFFSQVGETGKPEDSESKVFVWQIQDGIDEGRYHRVNPEQFVISIIGMCVYPFVARPLIKFWLKKEDDQFKDFMEDRQREVIDYAFRILIKDYQPYADNHR